MDHRTGIPWFVTIPFVRRFVPNLAVISEVTFRLVLVQCGQSRSGCFGPFKKVRPSFRDETHKAPGLVTDSENHHTDIISIYEIEERNRERCSARERSSRAGRPNVDGRARGRETHSQFYSPSYYPGLLRRNGLTIIARFHHLDRRFTLLPVAVTITSS